MANYAALMGLGRGLSAAGEAIDRNFQLQMEQMRQKSLQELESRRLDIAQQEANDNRAYRQGMLKAETGRSYDAARAQFQERMDKAAEQLAVKLPDQANRDMAARLLKQVMGDEALMASFYDKNGELDTEALSDTINTLAGSLKLGGVFEEGEGQAAIARFAQSMAKEWKAMQKRFPDIAADMSPADIIDQIPAFYSEQPRDSGAMFAPSSTPAGGTPPPSQVAASTPSPPAEDRPLGLKVSEGLMGLGGAVKGAATGLMDAARGYSDPSAATAAPRMATPGQQRAYELGFIDEFGNPTGVRQTPRGYGPQLQGPLNMGNPADDMNTLMSR